MITDIYAWIRKHHRAALSDDEKCISIPIDLLSLEISPYEIKQIAKEYRWRRDAEGLRMPYELTHLAEGTFIALPVKVLAEALFGQADNPIDALLYGV